MVADRSEKREFALGVGGSADRRALDGDTGEFDGCTIGSGYNARDLHLGRETNTERQKSNQTLETHLLA